MGRNVRDKLHKKISKSQVERKKIVFLPTCIGMPFLQKLMFPSRLNKYSLDLIFLLTNHKPKQTPQIFLEHVLSEKKDNQA